MTAPLLVEFPAVVQITDPAGGQRTVGNAKVFVWPDRAAVYVDSPAGPQLAVETSYVTGTSGIEGVAGSSVLPRDRVHTLVLADGSSWRISRSGWCGCGSRLRGFSPMLPDVAPVAR